MKELKYPDKNLIKKVKNQRQDHFASEFLKYQSMIIMYIN